MVSDDTVGEETDHSWKDNAYFDTGQRAKLDERKIWHGNAWHTPDGELRIPAGPETSVCIEEDGETKVYHDRRRCW